MSNLDTPADKAVRDAVDAFMEGRLTPELSGETVFETKNSRYRLLDGVVFAAPDDGLIGAELVGWLMETSRRSVVGSAWQPGARAVLVDRHRGRNIIVTSTTRLLHLEEHISSDPPTQGRNAAPQGWNAAPPAHAEPPFPSGETPEPPPRALAPQRARIIPSTPPPPAAVAQRRAAALHLPPRPIALGAMAPSPTPLPVPARPLPVPAPPPRRDAAPYPGPGVTMGEAPGPAPLAAFPPPLAPQVNPLPPAAATTPWELTSSEFEMETEDTEPDPGDDNPVRYDASRQHEGDSADAPTEELAAGPESGGDAPIPLVKAILPAIPRPRR